jgi:hypothetical protein
MIGYGWKLADGGGIESRKVRAVDLKLEMWSMVLLFGNRVSGLKIRRRGYISHCPNSDADAQTREKQLDKKQRRTLDRTVT